MRTQITPTLAFLAAVAVGFAVAAPAHAQDAAEIGMAVLRVEHERPLPISRLDLPPEDLGFAGGALATGDNQTTGSFMGQNFTVEMVSAPPEGATEALEALLAAGVQYVATLADGETTVALANAAGERAVILNAGAPDAALRGETCRANLFNVAPSRAMLTDALAQYLVWKRWDSWFLIEGSHPRDTALADAYRASAEKFGAEIVETRVFEDTGGARSTDSGIAQVQAQLPVFTQNAEDHDVVIVADESQVFAAYMPYHTWDARPVAGSAGLQPVSWHPAHESWGARQLQNRFEEEAGRPMRPEDFDVWTALRAVGEAATRSGSSEFGAIRDFMRGEELEIAAFKGQALTFRNWDNQLRQPVLLATDGMIVSVSPQAEFVHQVSPLDTLGTDEPETTCAIN